MIPVRMGDQDMVTVLTLHGIDERRDMGLAIGPGSMDREPALADDIGERSFERCTARDCSPSSRRTPGLTSRPAGRQSKLLSKGMSRLIGHA